MSEGQSSPSALHRAEVTVHTLPDRSLRLIVRGDIDAASVEFVRRPLDQFMIKNSAVEIDMAGVSFLDSEGIRVLVSAHRRGAEIDTKVRIVNPSPAVARVLVVTGVYERLVETS